MEVRLGKRLEAVAKWMDTHIFSRLDLLGVAFDRLGNRMRGEKDSTQLFSRRNKLQTDKSGITRLGLYQQLGNVSTDLKQFTSGVTASSLFLKIFYQEQRPT